MLTTVNFDLSCILEGFYCEEEVSQEEVRLKNFCNSNQDDRVVSFNYDRVFTTVNILNNKFYYIVTYFAIC